jgi:hypothetical protein
MNYETNSTNHNLIVGNTHLLECSNYNSNIITIHIPLIFPDQNYLASVAKLYANFLSNLLLRPIGANG